MISQFLSRRKPLRRQLRCEWMNNAIPKQPCREPIRPYFPNLVIPYTFSDKSQPQHPGHPQAS